MSMRDAITDTQGLPPVTGFGAIRAHWRSKDEAGGCNFCTDKNHQKVLVVHGCHLEVRFCRTCLNKIKEEAKETE